MQGARVCGQQTSRGIKAGAADRSRGDQLSTRADAEEQGRQTDERPHPTPDDAVSLAAREKVGTRGLRADICNGVAAVPRGGTSHALAPEPERELTALDAGSRDFRRAAERR